MRIRLLSDIHNEFYRINGGGFPFPHMDGDEDTTLVLAGDIDVANHVFDFVENIRKYFKYVVYVAGNHCFWKTNIDIHLPIIRRTFAEMDNAFFLEGDSVELDGIRFAGGTLWTDYRGGCPLSMMDAKMMMADYRKIRAGSNYRKFSPNIAHGLHVKVKEFLMSETREGRRPDVVVTHHAPHPLCVNPRFHGSSTNDFYYTDLTEVIEYVKPQFWFHGHMHDAVDITVDQTRIICNPVAYPSEQVAVPADLSLVLNVSKEGEMNG